MSILVLGSFMMDQVVSTPRAPQNGETIIGDSFATYPGGKGANQAVAASRLGSEVIMAGKIGDDSNGERFIKTLKNEDINTNWIEVDKDQATGVGFVTSERDGNNRIIVVPGANLKYDFNDLKKLYSVLDKVNVLIMQLEMDIAVMEEAAKIAKEKGVKVILNPAPGQKISNEFMSNIDYLTPNETELEILTDMKVTSTEDAIQAAKILLNRGVENIIVTLGDNGALVVNKNFEAHVEGYTVPVKDTVAAGDAFNGALAVSIENNIEITEAIKYANATGALTVTKNGAIPSIPTRDEVNAFLNSNE